MVGLALPATTHKNGCRVQMSPWFYGFTVLGGCMRGARRISFLPSRDGCPAPQEPLAKARLNQRT